MVGNLEVMQVLEDYYFGEIYEYGGQIIIC